MAGEAEVDRMVVRLIGDGATFQKMMREAQASTRQASASMKSALNGVEKSVDGLTRGLDGKLRHANGRFATDQERLQHELAQTNSVMAKGVIIARNYADSLMSAGKMISFRVTLPIAALGAAAIKVGSDFESGFAGVKKTVEATPEELAKLRQSFKDMSNELPVATTELLKIGEIAGQLGIKTPNILKFSKTIADMGVSTDLSTEAAATGMARLANIMGMSQDKFDNLGSSIVALGNSMATSEPEILNMSLRIAGAGKTVGMSVDQVTALAAALSDVGIEAEMGGSAISMFLLGITEDVATGADSLKTFAKVTKMSVDEFSTLFRKDATGALVKVLEGLKSLDKESKVQALGNMGAEGSRMIATLLQSSEAVDRMKDALALSSKEFEKGTALANEANQRYKTFASTVIAVKNNIGNLLEEGFQMMRPTLLAIIEQVRSAVEWFRGLSEQTKKTVIVALALTAAVGPATIAIAGLIKVIGALKLSMMSTGIGAVVIILGTLAAHLLSTEEGVAGVTKVLAPFKELWGALGELWEEMKPALAELTEMVVGDLKAGLEALVPVIEFIVKGITQQVKIITGTLEALGNIENGIRRLTGQKEKEEGGTLSEAASAVSGGRVDLGVGGLAGAMAERLRLMKEAAEKEKEVSKTAVDFMGEDAAIEKEKNRQKAIQDTIDALKEEAATYGLTERELLKYELAQAGATEEVIHAALAEFDLLESRKKEAEKLKEDTKKEEDRQKGIRDTIAKLREQTETYGMSAEQLEVYRLKKAGASKEQIATAQALANEVASLDKEKEAKEEVAKSTDEAREAEKRFRDSFKTGGIEGVGRGLDALARIEESRMNRASAQKTAVGPSPSSLASAKLQELLAARHGGANPFGNPHAESYLKSIAESSKRTADKESVTLKPAGIATNG